MAVSAKKQVTQSASEAAQAVDQRKGVKAEPTLADLLNVAKGKSNGSTIKASNWVGTITINDAEMARLPLFLEVIGGSNWHTKFIGYVIEAQQSGEPLHCANEAEVEELNSSSGEALGMKSKDNDRLKHDWGGQLLGLKPYKGQRFTALVKAGFKDGMFAALKVTK
tara:strand:+ start:1437 stop:1934 length:498 start_codon:yes stop_codon:yes gene_type:complete